MVLATGMWMTMPVMTSIVDWALIPNWKAAGYTLTVGSLSHQ